MAPHGENHMHHEALAQELVWVHVQQTGIAGDTQWIMHIHKSLDTR